MAWRGVGEVNGGSEGRITYRPSTALKWLVRSPIRHILQLCEPVGGHMSSSTSFPPGTQANKSATRQQLEPAVTVK